MQLKINCTTHETLTKPMQFVGAYAGPQISLFLNVTIDISQAIILGPLESFNLSCSVSLPVSTCLYIESGF